MDGERRANRVLGASRHLEMFIKNAGSSDNGRMLQTGLEGSKMISDVSSDGNSILYQYQTEAGTGTSIYGQSLAGGKPFLIGLRSGRRTAKVVAGRRLDGVAVE